MVYEVLILWSTIQQVLYIIISNAYKQACKLNIHTSSTLLYDLTEPPRDESPNVQKAGRGRARISTQTWTAITSKFIPPSHPASRFFNQEIMAPKFWRNVLYSFSFFSLWIISWILYCSSKDIPNLWIYIPVFQSEPWPVVEPFYRFKESQLQMRNEINFLTWSRWNVTWCI